MTRHGRHWDRGLLMPGTLWTMFTIVVVLSAAGLWLLSRHAMKLSRDQWENRQRQDVQQNLRVALWRLDSRLAPYVATLHDPLAADPLETDQFVRERFKLQRSTASKAGSPGISLIPVPTGTATGSEWNRFESGISTGSLASAVATLMPADRGRSAAELLQNYGIDPNERGIQSRNRIVQQQVAMNAFKPVTKGTTPKKMSPEDGAVEPDAPTVDTRLMTIWVADQLVSLRSGEDVAEVDGVWIDWDSLRRSLVDEIADVVPGARLEPVHESDRTDPTETLAAIPVRVVPAQPDLTAPSWSPTHTALALSWAALAVAVLIAGLALNRSIALSEHRSAFASAVTHELRTPLTTFRLYSDLLARNMIESEEDRRAYLTTLRREADRLTHLVDNVLRYSKLQRTSKAVLESVTVSQWIDRITPRLSSRLDEADMRLVVGQEGDGPWKTDPQAMEQVIFNLIDNAAKYARPAHDRRVHLDVQVQETTVRLSVTDHGPGIPASMRSSVFRPFTKSAERAAETAQGVGLGLALAKQTTETLGGRLTHRVAPGGGATFEVRLPRALSNP